VNFEISLSLKFYINLDIHFINTWI